MSSWSQVAITFRIDYMGIGLDFEKIFGKTIRPGDASEKWWDSTENPQNYLPRGSEGSLGMSVWESPSRSYVDRYVVTLFGSLRDHEEEDVEELLKWFDEKCNQIEDYQAWILQAVLSVENDDVGVITKTYRSKED